MSGVDEPGLFNFIGELVVLIEDYRRAERRASAEDAEHYLLDAQALAGAAFRHDWEGFLFVFIGFSLSDPNFSLIHDEVRLATGDDMPVRYVVHGRRDPVKEAYLRSMGVNTVTLDWWESLPQFLAEINPAN